MSTLTTVPQHEAALAKANEIRRLRSELKARLAGMGTADSRAFAADLICDPPDDLRTMKARDLLCACHRTGPLLAARWMRSAAVGDAQVLRSLTTRQRLALARHLRPLPHPSEAEVGDGNG